MTGAAASCRRSSLAVALVLSACAGLPDERAGQPGLRARTRTPAPPDFSFLPGQPAARGDAPRRSSRGSSAPGRVRGSPANWERAREFLAPDDPRHVEARPRA